MDIRRIKAQYGARLCVLGNVDLNLLGAGTAEQVRHEVRQLIQDLGPGGGYILTSGNSVAGYCKPANVLAMAQTVQQEGTYPL